MRVRPAAAAAAAFAASACPAMAAEVSTTTECRAASKGCARVTVAVYRAAPGEANDFGIALSRDAFVLRDRVPIAAGRGCRRRSDGTVACRAHEVIAELGDGADVAKSDLLPTGLPSVPAVTLDGGPGADELSGAAQLEGGDGDDRLTGSSLSGGAGRDALVATPGGGSIRGGPGEDVLAGTADADWLSGGGDADVLVGGAGDDHLNGDDESLVGGPDVLDGGPGSDTVSYAHGARGVRVDLAAQTGGAPGEGDRLSGFEHAEGGEGDDVLIGDGGANRIDGREGRNTIAGGGGDDELQASGSSVLGGGEGDDLLDGGAYDDVLAGDAGADRLVGGFGVDRYDGGAGDDILEPGSVAASGLRREQVACGHGGDAVLSPGLALLLADCEQVTPYSAPVRLLPAYPRVLDRGRLSFTILRARRFRGERLELRLRDRSRPFAARRIPRRRGTARVRVRIPPAIGDLRRDPLPVQVSIGGRRSIHHWVIDLPR
jgi:Ca2+-binding RTX toxin-like protein